MTIQIADPDLVAKIERLSIKLGTGVTAALETAVDHMLANPSVESATEAAHPQDNDDDPWADLDDIVDAFRALPHRTDAHDPLEWDEWGLPR